MGEGFSPGGAGCAEPAPRRGGCSDQPIGARAAGVSFGGGKLEAGQAVPVQGLARRRRRWQVAVVLSPERCHRHSTDKCCPLSAKRGWRPHVALSLAPHAAQPSPLAPPRQEGELGAVGQGWCLSLKLQGRSSPRSRGKGPQRAGGKCMHLLSRWPQLVSLAPLHQPARRQSLEPWLKGGASPRHPNCVGLPIQKH